MSNIENLSAYTLIKKENLDEVKGVGYLLSHNKTKARVMVVVNDDSNKVFTIGFRTPPADDSGIPHIMEHSVLCGSKKFPAKDPFVELCKGSLNTFLNALTYSDKTIYPIASLNKKDFHNLMHVYLDAVFYPNIYSRTEIMEQEGWHYEIDDNGDLFINGVVYNEMKGVYSSPEEVIYRIIENSLLSDTAYAFESGGDPKHIPEITREKFLDFHKKYYHPSNSYIYLYGDMDACEELNFIDEEYLSSFEYADIDSALTDEKPYTEPKLIEQYYSLSESEDEKDNTYLAYNAVIGKSTDKKLSLAYTIIEHALFNAAGAPIKKAIIDAGIGKDIITSYDDGINQPTFSIIAKNANASDKDTFIKIIDNSLKDIVTNGINKRAFLASLNRFEFKHKEANFKYPKGLMLGINAFSTWLYDDMSALDLFTLNDVYDELKSEIENDTRYFEEIIEKYLINNNHKSYICFMPKKGLNAIEAKEEKARLADVKASMTEEELAQIKAAAEHLKEYQSEPSTKEELESIPMLKISDIEKQAKPLNNHVSEIEMVKIVSHDIFTNGISYLSLNFDITDLECKKYPYVALLTEILKYVDTENYTENDLASEINLHTGGIGFTTSVISQKEIDTYRLDFVVNIKALDDKIDKAMQLVEEILYTSKIDDKKRLKEIIAEDRSVLKEDLVSSGHLTASSRATSYVSAISAVKEYMDGVDYYKFIADLDDNFEDRYEDLVEELKTVIGEILSRNALTVSFTSDKDPMDIIKTPIERLSKKLSSRLRFDKNDKIVLEKKNEGFKTASQVQYVAAAGNFVKAGLEYTGALRVLKVIFSYDYLWINVRVKGGAYGSMCSFARSGNSYLTSYRDPNLMETYDIYKNAAEYVKEFDADDRDMTKYIIGAISKLDTPMNPVTEGNFSFVGYLLGLTDEKLQQERDEVLNADVKTIRALAPYVEAIIDAETICAIGDENKLEAAKDYFKTVENVF